MLHAKVATLDLVAYQPSASTLTITVQLHASHSMTWPVQKDEKFTSYHVQRIQELEDYTRCVEFIGFWKRGR